MATIYMIGTEESVKYDSFTDGPTPNKQYILNNIKEGEIIIGKSQGPDYKIVSAEQMRDGKLIDVIPLT